MRKSVTIAVFLLGALIIAGFVFLGPFNDITGYATSDSQVGNLSASIQTYMACTWSDETLDVSFGSLLNPGTNDVNATQNYAGTDGGTLYNVSVDALSTANADILIKGNSMVDGANEIGVGNITWASSTTSASDNASMNPASSTSLTVSDTTLATSISPESNAHYRFWLDIPIGTVAGNYIGNYTITCQEAG